MRFYIVCQRGSAEWSEVERGHVSGVRKGEQKQPDSVKAGSLVGPRASGGFPGQPRLPTAIFTTIFWQVRVIEQAFVIWQTSLWLPCLGSQNAPRVVVFNTLLIGPHSNSGCNVFRTIRGNVLSLNV